MCDWASLIESLSQVSVMPSARTGGESLSSSSVSLMKGSFHRLSLPAAGDILLPFNKSRRETVEGKLGRVVGGELGTGSGALEVAVVVGSSAAVPSLTPGSWLEILSAFPTSEGLSPLSCSRSDAIKKTSQTGWSP